MTRYLLNEYDFTVTEIYGYMVEHSVKIKEILDKERLDWYSGSINPQISGSWDDYYTYRKTDPTGSYLTPYITTIGLYDEDNNMLAVAKLPNPIKNLPDYDVNFIIRLDT